MNSKKRNIIIVSIIIFGISVFGVVMLIRSSNDKENKKGNDNEKKESNKNEDDEKENIRQLKDVFLNYEAQIKSVQGITGFTKRIEDIKMENGIEIHTKHFLLSGINLNPDLRYTIESDQKNKHGKKKHRLTLYNVMKGNQLVGYKLVMEIDKN